MHIACWSRNAPEVVNLLLEKDSYNRVLSERVDAEKWDRIKNSNSTLWGLTSSRGTYESMFTDLNGLTALHVCLLGGTETADITRLVLRKELSNMPTRVARQVSMDANNSDGHNAFHLACIKKADPETISLLLELDKENHHFVQKDARENRPFHYLCLHSAPIESIKVMLQAEERFYEDPKDISVFHSNAQSMSPIDIAVKSNASIDIIELLLRPKYFNIQTQDDYLLDKLGQLISDYPSLQKNLIHKMAERKILAVIWLESSINTLAIVSFFFGASGVDNLAVFICLIISMSLFVIREAMQLASQKSNYLFDLYNYYNILNYSLLVVAIIFLKTGENEYKEEIFLVCGLMLVGNGIYFLRQSFLPFARFFGGLVCQLNTDKLLALRI